MTNYKLLPSGTGIDAGDLTTGASTSLISKPSRKSNDREGKCSSPRAMDGGLDIGKNKVNVKEHERCANNKKATDKAGHRGREEKVKEQQKKGRESKVRVGASSREVKQDGGYNNINISHSGLSNKGLKQDACTVNNNDNENANHFQQLKENYKPAIVSARSKGHQVPASASMESSSTMSGGIDHEGQHKMGKISSKIGQLGKEINIRGDPLEGQRDQGPSVVKLTSLKEKREFKEGKMKGKKRKKQRSEERKSKKRRHHENSVITREIEIQGKGLDIGKVIHGRNLSENQSSCQDLMKMENENTVSEGHGSEKRSATIFPEARACGASAKCTGKFYELYHAQKQLEEDIVKTGRAERKHLPKECCIVRDVSVQATELQAKVRGIRSTPPVVLEAFDEEVATAIHTSTSSPSIGKDAELQQHHKLQEDTRAAQIPEPLYKFPTPGIKPWLKLKPLERMERISRGERRGKFNCIPESLEQSQVYASVMDLTSSDEVLALLIRWLQCSVGSQGKQVLEASNTILAHAWALIEYVLREDKNRLEGMKQEVDLEQRITPRIAEWERAQRRKEDMCRVIVRLWGANWQEKCTAELKEVHKKGYVSWSEPFLSKLKELAALAVQKGIERKEAWALILNVALEKVPNEKKKNIKVVLDVLEETANEIMKRTSQLRLNCGCPFSLREIVPNLPTPRKCGTLMSRKDAVELLKVVHIRLPDPERSFDLLCHSHLRRLASGTFGLLNNTTPHDILVERINCVFNDLGEEGENPHYEKNPQWFRKPFRPTSGTGISDNEYPELGLYRYQVMNPNSITHAFSDTPTMAGLSTFTFDREIIFTRFSSPGKFQEFLQHGTVRIPGLFTHLNPEIIEQEFNMYCHHFQPPPGTKPMGWLRIMYHSLTQQAIRQDPIVYALHCAAREDGCWRFISYPYYTKSTSPTGEKTGFFHFDLNVSEYLSTGKSKHVVQSAVTLINDETSQGCTVLIPGFHRHVKEWWSRHPDAPRGGETTNIIPGKTYTKQDEWDFGPFIPYPCRAGDLRLTRPDIPHGSTPVSKDTRRVVFPWLIGIRDDHETLDVDTTETWSQLALCHRDLTACRKSTSGRSASAYGRPDEKFAAAVRMGSTSFIGDALVGRRRWDDVEVVRERDLLLGEGSKEVDVMKWVEEVRGRIKREFERCWEVVRMVEREEFGRNAYFRSRV